MAETKLQLEWLPGRFAVCRLGANDEAPAWILEELGPRKRGLRDMQLISVTRTDSELSIVVEESRVPANVRNERGFVAFRIVGVVDFGLVGILATLTSALAAAKIPVFAIGTFDTDLFLVRETYAHAVAGALAKIADIPQYSGPVK